MAKKPAPKKAAPKSKTAAKSPPKGKGAASKPAAKGKTPANPKPAPKTKPADKVAPKAAAKPVEKQPSARSAPKPAPVRPATPAPVPKPASVAPAPPPAPTPKAVASPPPAPRQAGGKTSALTVAAQAVPGQASAGNTQPANILVLVTCAGEAVADLNLDHFSIMEHFDVPGQLYPFSNNIVGFKNAGTGAYQLQVKPISNSPWKGGQHLAQILVATEDERQGQAAVKLIIR